jgi:hypothetical protein
MCPVHNRKEPMAEKTTKILFACYGVWNSINIRTHEAQGLIEDAYAQREEIVHFFASNDTWGPDPSVGNRKYFFCGWEDDGKSAYGVVGEGDSKGVVVPTGHAS